MSYTVDASTGAVNALVTYLATALSGTCTVLKGWPETDIEADIATLPVLSVVEVPGGVEDNPASPALLGSVAAGVVTVTQGPMSIAVQLDLFAPYRATLETVGLAVDAALHNDLPWRPHLYLTATGYDSAPMTIIRLSTRTEFDGETAQRGEWRRTWSLRAELDRRASVTMNTMDTIDTTLTTS